MQKLAPLRMIKTGKIINDYVKKVKQLLIKKLLYGHTDAVTCLAASPAWSIAVSGSRDRSAIIWDLSRYVYVKHLPDHAGPVATVAINDLTGDIVTCAGSLLYVWDIGGRLLASIDTSSVCPPLSPLQPKQQQILCVAASQMNEWDRENVIITGSSDGVVRMWSMDFVEVSVSELRPKPGENENDQRGRDRDIEAELAQRKLSITAHLASKMKNPDENNADEDVATTHIKATNDEAASDCSEGFVVVGPPNPEPSSVPPTDYLLEKEPKSSCDGYEWKRQLVFRAKLTMHTAFERPDNADPAAVTALAVGRDHRTVYVGDERGRVFSWSVASKPGKGMVDHWWKDEGVGACVQCGTKFTIYERRHHCRNCGKVFCSCCSQYQAEIPRLKILQPVRVCKPCHDSLANSSEETTTASPKKKCAAAAAVKN